MKLILVTGLSGGGKSIAIRQLEDCGYYCIDNLPAEFLLPVTRTLARSETKMATVAIDARSHATFDSTLASLKTLRAEGFDVRILYLTASTPEITLRFSETRRRHPLSTHARAHSEEVTLQEAIERERMLLEPVCRHACVLDTTGLLPAQLRRWVRQFVDQPESDMTLAFESFAFKYGVPGVADLVFDVRCLPNPYYTPELRPLTGRDQPVSDFLADSPLVARMVDDIARFLETWLPAYRAQNRHYLTVCIGCTGGQHRSVYVAETLAKRFNAIVRHRVIEQNALLNPERARQSL